MINFGCERRCEALGQYIVAHGATVRDTAKIFGISKSTVHKDVTKELLQINPELGERVRAILEINKSERHLRGGEATRKKYCRQIKKDGA